ATSRSAWARAAAEWRLSQTELRSEGHGSAVAADQPLEELALEREAATDEVVVLDYGGQYSQLIARRVRECGVFSELLPHHVGVEEIARRRPRGIILSGGPASVYAPEVGEFGRSDLRVTEPGRLLAGLPAEQTCWMSHRDTVFEAPPGFTALASSTQSPVAALESVE